MSAEHPALDSHSQNQFKVNHVVMKLLLLFSVFMEMHPSCLHGAFYIYVWLQNSLTVVCFVLWCNTKTLAHLDVSLAQLELIQKKGFAHLRNSRDNTFPMKISLILELGWTVVIHATLVQLFIKWFAFGIVYLFTF